MRITEEMVKDTVYTGAVVVGGKAGGFLMANAPFLIGFAAVSGESLAWLPHWLNWLEHRLRQTRGR